MGSLDGVLVLDLSRKLPGPYCSMILADHGARVITIEDRRFEGEGSFPTLLNRNKEHIALNLMSDEGREIFFRLVKRSDVVMEGFKPGVVTKLGINYEVLRGLNPRIVYCSISGYGQDGPLRERPGHDINYLAESGVLDGMGSEETPFVPGVQVADIAGGSMNALSGILLALYEREKSGLGQAIDISMTDCCLPLNAISLELWQMTGMPPRRASGILSHRYAFYNVYQTKEGGFIVLGALEPHFWMAVCDYFGVPEYAVLQFDEERREEIIAFFAEQFAAKSRDEWEEELGELLLCFSVVKSLPEAMDSHLFASRGMVVPLPGEADQGRKTFGVSIRMGRTPGAVRRAPEGFGKGGTRILRELGYGEAKVASLLDRGVI